MPRLRRYWRLLRIAGVVLSGLIVAGALGIAERCAIPVSALRKQQLTQWFLTRLAAACPFAYASRASYQLSRCCGSPIMSHGAISRWACSHRYPFWPKPRSAPGRPSASSLRPPARCSSAAAATRRWSIGNWPRSWYRAPSIDLPRRHLDRWHRRANLPPRLFACALRGRLCRPAGRHSLLAQRQAGHRRPFVGDDELPAICAAC